MSEQECGTIREMIPEFVRDTLSAEDEALVRGHVAKCGECGAELELASALLASRAEVPAGLAERVVSAVRSDRSTTTRPWWGVTAAAVAAIALGIGIASEPATQGAEDVPGYAYEVDEGAIWSSDDGLLAGAPLLDDLTDEALEQLLDELSVGSSGGAA